MFANPRTRAVSAMLLGACGIAAAGGWGSARADETAVRLSVDVESKLHYRHSKRNRFAVPFPFPPGQLPPGQDRAFLETVDPGHHVELSIISLIADLEIGPEISAHGKLDLIDFHDRNPTSGDRRVDIDQLWLQYGTRTAAAVEADGAGGYVRIGKFGKLERQDDRHLESYGVVSTAFNRFEDNGVEFGLDLGPRWYLRGSITEGNPLFFRDPNALAGDNGTDEFLQPNPVPKFNSGIPIIYDAEVEDVNFLDNPELGLAAGYRFENESGNRAFEVMAFGYQGELADSEDLEGTFYGGDLDFLRGPFNQFPFPGLRGNDRSEYGVTVWAYLDQVSLFAQYVDQEVASLPRRGFEFEAAWRIDLPLVWALGGEQLFTSIQPALRLSHLDNDFANPEITPFPSGSWDWVKIDAGLRLAILSGLDLTAEFTDNRFETAAGTRSNDEWLVTLRWRF